MNTIVKSTDIERVGDEKPYLGSAGSYGWVQRDDLVPD
jgi:hypothetical protein